MLRSLYLRTIHERRRSLMWWLVGLAMTALWVVAFYPSIREGADEYTKILEQMPEGLRNLFGGAGIDLATPEGYLSVEVFSFVVPVLFLIFAVGFGASTLAGEERRGTLDVLLAHPISRSRTVLQKTAGLLTGLLGLGIALWAALAAGSALADMGVSPLRLGQAVVSALLLAAVFGLVALAVGAFTGSRPMAIGVSSALAVGTYLLNALAPLAEPLEPYRLASPFYYYSAAEPLKNGLDPLHAAVLLGIAALFGALATVAFERRDLQA